MRINILITNVLVFLRFENSRVCFQALLWLKHRSSQTLIMNCYFSIGCDAAVTLNFHRQRESNPSMFKNRLFNKVALAFRNRKKCTISAENLLITQRAATKMYKKCTFSAINHKKLCARTRKITMFSSRNLCIGLSPFQQSFRRGTLGMVLGTYLKACVPS